MTQRYEIPKEVKAGDLVWKCDYQSIKITGPYIVQNWTQHWAGGQRWILLDTQTGQTFTCFKQNLRVPHAT